MATEIQNVPAPAAGPEETRARILAATRQLYAERGSRGTTTREIADLAGVNEATLFRHFGTKQQLIDAMLDHFSQATVGYVLNAVQRVATLESIDEQLYELGLAAVASIREKRDLIKVSMAEETQNPEGHSCAWRAPSLARERLTGYFRTKIDAGILKGDPEFLTRSFMSLGFAYVIAAKVWSDYPHSSDEAVRQLVQLFLNGARA